MFKIVKRKASKLCKAYRCANESAKGQSLCHKHHKRRQKELNPIGYFFNLLKQNAKRRGKEFKLALWEFRQFCSETNYLEVKGRSGRAKTIDRIDPNKGYEIGNIQLLSNRANAAKRWADVPF